MKKQAYITPATRIYKVESQNIMAASGPDKVYSDESNGISDEAKILSRRSGGLWDDEED